MISFAIFLVLKAKESKKKGVVKIIHVINACRTSCREGVDVSWDWISGEGWSVFRGWQEFAVLCGLLTRCFVRVRHSASSGCHEALPEGVMKHCMRTSRSAPLQGLRGCGPKRKRMPSVGWHPLLFFSVRIRRYFSSFAVMFPSMNRRISSVLALVRSVMDFLK